MLTMTGMERTEIRLAGSGGQGLILGMQILFRALGLEGKRAAQSQSYEPTSRGGYCYSDLILAERSVRLSAGHRPRHDRRASRRSASTARCPSSSRARW